MMLDFSKFSLGTVQFGKKYGLKNIQDKIIDLYEIEKIFNFFHKNKGCYIDTARNYGESEKIISDFLTYESKVISKFQVNTDKDLISEIELSLNDLKINKLDTALIHNPEELNKDKKSVKNLLAAKKEGLCSKIGISVYSYKDIEIIENILPIKDIDVIQVQGNAFDKKFFKNKKINLLLKRNNIRIDIRSIFLQGLLLQDLKDAISLFPSFADEINSWHQYCYNNNMSLLYAALLNALSLHKGNSLLLFGCRSVNEIKSIFLEIKKLNISDSLYMKKIPTKLSDPRLWKS